MTSTANRGPKTRPKFIQTVLQFPSIKTDRLPCAPVHAHRAPQTAPELPQELWNLILPRLSNLTLKSLRLVCSSWSKLGAQRLFSTVYLDSFEQSWRKLESLSSSSFAPLVRAIECSPLYLPSECLDAEPWGETYSNLLTGLNHSDRFDLFHIYRHVFKRFNLGNRDQAPSIEAEMSRMWLAKLENWHRLILTDHSDTRIRCSDPLVARRIQRDQKLLNRPSTWALKPPAIPRNRHDYQFQHGMWPCEYLLEAIKCSPTITHLDIRLWDFVWGLLEHNTIWPSPKPYSSLTHFTFSLKFCPVEPVNFDQHQSNPSPHLNAAFLLAHQLPEIKKFYISAKYSEPDFDFCKQYRHPEREQDDNVASSCSDDLEECSVSDTSSVSTSWSRISQASPYYEDPPAGLNRGHLHSLSAHPASINIPFDKLEFLELSDLCICANRLLICLLCRPRAQQKHLKISIRGNTIIYGISPQIFLTTLSLLGVALDFDREQVLYYETESPYSISEISTSVMSVIQLLDSPSHEPIIIRRFAVRSPPDMKSELEAELDDQQRIPQLLAKIENLETASCRVRVRQYPSQITSILDARGLRSRRCFTYYYCCWSRFKKTLSFGWYDKPLTSSSPDQDIFLLLRASSHSHFLQNQDNEVIVDYSSDGWYEYAEDQYAAFDTYERGGAYELLEMYENELLSLDIMRPLWSCDDSQ